MLHGACEAGEDGLRARHVQGMRRESWGQSVPFLQKAPQSGCDVVTSEPVAHRVRFHSGVVLQRETARRGLSRDVQRPDGVLGEAMFDGLDVFVDEFAGQEEETVRCDVLTEAGESLPGAHPGLILCPQTVLDGLLPHLRQELADSADPDRDLDAPLGPRKVFVRLVPTDSGYHLLLHGGVRDGLEDVHLLGTQQAETLGEAGVQEDDLNLAVSESLNDPLLGLRGHARCKHPVLDPRGLEK